jgi:hypothetical protein
MSAASRALTMAAQTQRSLGSVHSAAATLHRHLGTTLEFVQALPGVTEVVQVHSSCVCLSVILRDCV